MMKLDRTINYNFGWVLFIGLVDLVFLFLFFLLLSSNLILQHGISISIPVSRFTLGPQSNQQIISITGGAVPAIYFQDQRVSLEQLGQLLDAAKRKDQSIIIKADRSASYETVARVTNAVLEHGITSVALAATPPQPRQHKAVFAIFVVMSLVGHAFCFYVFQIVYPTPVALLPPPAGVTFIAPDSEQGRTLLRWIDAEDPALAFTTHAPPQTKLDAISKAEHVPSYFALDPPLKKIPAFKPDLRIPSSRPPGAVPILSRKTVSAGATGRTYISFSKELKQFGVASIPQSRFAASHEETPETLRFRIAVSDLGEIRYCFPVNSSGDPALDEQGRLQLVRSRFSPSRITSDRPGLSLVWGTATIQWGSDVARQLQAPAATVTP